MQHIVVELLGWLIVLAPLLTIIWFTLEICFGLTPLPSEQMSAISENASCVIIIPAHNEAVGIARTVSTLLSEPINNCSILVVADNCLDETAAIARHAGANVIERNEPLLRGKGYALAFARDHLRSAPPNVVVVVDADCAISRSSIEALIKSVRLTGRPAQAVDVFQPDHSLRPLAQISGFAMLVKNHLRLRGLFRLGHCCLLCGTGMAFAWFDLATAPLATGNVVEDLGLAITLIRAGRLPQLVESAKVISPAAAVNDSIAQRSRWELGFVRMARRQALPTLWHGLSRFNQAEIALGMHLMVPPLALLSLLTAIALAASVSFALLTSLWLPTAILAVAVGTAAVFLLCAWMLEGRETLSFGALLRAPVYVFWKLPIYLKIFRGGQASWNRTRRDGE